MKCIRSVAFSAPHRNGFGRDLQGPCRPHLGTGREKLSPLVLRALLCSGVQHILFSVLDQMRAGLSPSPNRGQGGASPPCTARVIHLPTSYLPCSQKPLSHHWLTPADIAELEMGTWSAEDGSC